MQLETTRAELHMKKVNNNYGVRKVQKLAMTVLGILSLLVGVVPSAAAENTSRPNAQLNTSTDTERSPRDIQWLETTRNVTHRAAYWLAESVDSWFGDKDYRTNGGEVTGYVRLNGLWEEGQRTTGNVRFRLRANFPNLKSRAYAFVGKDNEREEVIDQPEAFRKQQLLLPESRRDDQAFFAGLGYDLRDSVDFRIGVRGGLKAYVQGRYANQWALSEREMVYFRQTLFWSVSESLGATTVVDYERILDPSLSLRWANTGTVTLRSHGFEWYSSLGLFKALPRERLLSAEAIVQGETRAARVSNYGVRVNWQQPIYKDWLIGSANVGYFWPKDSESARRREAWVVGASVELRY